MLDVHDDKKVLHSLKLSGFSDQTLIHGKLSYKMGVNGKTRVQYFF